ncbi:NAD-binding protein [Kitasatospora cineracea]|uniref:Trk K+ transport system NAD-binding subunit n=1 Tax=Kitasatospora cineracea TaxID=88074 RepID=A0A3N4RM21_9ACTN|nr:NAD(P)-binding protein [Kitasatospora cineracea]RPE31871.1 Trk K+ transport system NAD-binding subunit [Kitasatospora cineracea]
MSTPPETAHHDRTVPLPGPRPPGASPHRAGHMVICGADALAHRLAFELAGRYGQQIVVLTPSLRDGHGSQIAALGTRHGLPVTVVEAPGLDEDALTAADVQHAAALALTSGDDQANLHAALRARRLNPDLRLVVRVFNRRLGQRVEQLLDQAVLARHPGLSAAALEASTTVLSTSTTATPSLVAAALGGRSHALHIDGQLLRVAEPEAGAHSDGTELAVLAAPAGPGSDPVLLPDPDTLGPDGDRTVLELLGRAAPPPRTRRRLGRSALPLGELFTRRLRWALAGLTALVLTFTALGWRISGQPPQHVAWLTVLDVLGIADPAEDAGPTGKTLQILAAIGGMLLMPFLIALALDALGTFRTATTLRRPPRNLSGHVVLVGLGRVGSRVLDRLRELDVPVVCVDRDPTAAGVARARTHGVPVVIGDATQDGVLDTAKAGRARALLALTSDDGTNLEAALAARELAPRLRVVLRLFDDDFAGDIYRALRDSYPHAETRSRSVSFLAAPAFASAMMGRQVLGAIAVGREVLLVAALDVTGNPHLAGRTVARAHRPGAWRVLALDLADPDRRSPDLADPYTTAPELRWNPDPDRLLADGDRVVVATTREGLGHLATGPVGPGPARAPEDGPADPGPSAGTRRSPLPRPAGPAS